MSLSELLHVLVATGKDPIVVACRFLFIIGRPLEHAGTVVMIVQRLPETEAETLPLDLLRIQVGNEGQEGLIQSSKTVQHSAGIPKPMRTVLEVAVVVLSPNRSHVELVAELPQLVSNLEESWSVSWSIVELVHVVQGVFFFVSSHPDPVPSREVSRCGHQPQHLGKQRIQPW